MSLDGLCILIRVLELLELLFPLSILLGTGITVNFLS